MLGVTLNKDIFDTINSNINILIVEPVSFLDMIQLESNASLIITDSGGVQKEAYFFRKPCIILRPETEWIELVENGAAILADANQDKIISSYLKFNNHNYLEFYPIFGQGNAADFICTKIIEHAEFN
jgi:UDP-GlcNAc3NAcA epimerase